MDTFWNPLFFIVFWPKTGIRDFKVHEWKMMPKAGKTALDHANRHFERPGAQNARLNAAANLIESCKDLSAGVWHHFCYVFGLSATPTRRPDASVGFQRIFREIPAFWHIPFQDVMKMHQNTSKSIKIEAPDNFGAPIHPQLTSTHPECKELKWPVSVRSAGIIIRT